MARIKFPPHVPTVSLNEFGSFACQSRLKDKRRIVDQRINPRPGITARYHFALNAICSCIRPEGFTEASTEQAYKAFQEAEYPGDFWPTVRERNITLMRRFRNICEKSSPPPGEHNRKRSGEYLEYRGVQISVLPDIITLCPQCGIFTYTKFRLSDDKYTWDASEYVLLILQKYAKTQEKELGLTFDMSQCKLVDCAAQHVFEGHKIDPRRGLVLKKAAEEYRTIWPTIKKIEKPRC